MRVIGKSFNTSIPIFRKTEKAAVRFLDFLILLLLCISAPTASAKLGYPEPKRFKLDELRKGLQSPFHLRVEGLPLTCLYNILQIPDRFNWLCEHFGAQGVAKLRSFLHLEGNQINPTFIEVDLVNGVLYYHPTGASGSDLVPSKEWAGEDLEDVANALNYAKLCLVAVADARQQYLTKRISWSEALAFCRTAEQSPLTTPEIKWSLRGILFSPQSEPDTEIAALKNSDPKLAEYAAVVKADWSTSQLLTGRIVGISNGTEVQVDSGSGGAITYKAFEFAIDAERKPVKTGSLELVSGKSEKGVLADVRYIEENGERFVVNCQLKGVTAPVVDSMEKWDGTYWSAKGIVQEVETITGKPAFIGIGRPSHTWRHSPASLSRTTNAIGDSLGLSFQ